MKHSIILKMADTVFRISCDEVLPIAWLRKNYAAFLSTRRPDIDIPVVLDKKWEERPDPFRPPPPRWRDDAVSFETQLFDVDLDFTKRRAAVRADPDFGPVDLVKCLYSMVLMKKGGFLLHASAILDKSGAYVFFGPSGSGKTTIARLAGERTVLTDETAAIAVRGDSYNVYATPFAGEYGEIRKNADGPVKAVFLIRKGASFCHEAIGFSDAARQLSCNAMVPAIDRKIADTLLGTFERFVRKVPCRVLYFKPEEEIWDYVS